MGIYWNYNLFLHLNTNSNKLYLIFYTCMCACPCVSVCIWGGCTSGCASVWRSDGWCLLCFVTGSLTETGAHWLTEPWGVFFSLYPQLWDNRHVWESCLAIFSTGTEVGIKAEPSPQPSSSLCLLHLVIHIGDHSMFVLLCRFTLFFIGDWMQRCTFLVVYW